MTGARDFHELHDVAGRQGQVGLCFFVPQDVWLSINWLDRNLIFEEAIVWILQEMRRRTTTIRNGESDPGRRLT